MKALVTWIDAVGAIALMVASVGCLVLTGVSFFVDVPSPPIWLVWFGIAAALRFAAKDSVSRDLDEDPFAPRWEKKSL